MSFTFVSLRDRHLTAAGRRARVLYILATSFYLPPEAFRCLQTSIELYVSSQKLTSDIYLLADARFNSARAILDLVEMADDAGDLGVLGDKGSDGWRAEAYELLNIVARTQSEFLQSSADDQTGSQTEPQEEAAMSQSGESDSVYEQQMPTQDSLLETLLTMVEARTAERELSETARAQVATLLDEARRVCEQLIGDERTSADIRWLTACLEARRASGEIGSAEDAAQLVAAVSNSSDEEVRNLALTTLLELLSAQAASSPPDVAWRILSQATKIATDYLTADAGTTPSIQMGGAVLTPRALFRASLCNTLSTLALRRGLLSESGLDAATKNLKALLVNAETYARKALDELQWASIAGAGPITLPAPAGWAAECVGRNATFEVLRALFYLSESTVPAEVATAAKGRLELLLARIRLMPRPIAPQDLERYIDDVSIDEGPLRPREVAFWKRLVG